MDVLMSIALKVLIYAFPVNKAGLNQWRVSAGGVDVLLGFWYSTEVALRWCHARQRGAFSKIGCVSHPIIKVFSASPNLSGGSGAYVGELCHQWSGVF